MGEPVKMNSFSLNMFRSFHVMPCPDLVGPGWFVVAGDVGPQTERRWGRPDLCYEGLEEKCRGGER